MITPLHSTAFNEQSYARYHREEGNLLFLDATFAYCVYYKGVHVLTVGFVPTAHGIFIPQIQMRVKKGNRWLYKLPKHIIAYVVDRMHEAFPTHTLYLPHGEGVVSKIRKSYPNTDKFDAKDAAGRIQRFYDPPLEGWERGDPVMTHTDSGRLLFYELKAA